MQYQYFTFRDLDKLNEKQKIIYQFYLREKKEVAEFSITENGQSMIVKTNETHEFPAEYLYRVFDLVIASKIYSTSLNLKNAFEDENGTIHRIYELYGVYDYEKRQNIKAFDWHKDYGELLADGINVHIYKGKGKTLVTC